MNDQELIEKLGGQIPLTIDLGVVELGLADLLSLRPGMSIAFKKPETFDATLRVGTVAWADAEVAVTESEVTVKIKELVPLKKLSAPISE